PVNLGGALVREESGDVDALTEERGRNSVVRSSELQPGSRFGQVLAWRSVPRAGCGQVEELWVRPVQQRTDLASVTSAAQSLRQTYPGARLL
ncbi:hypothetical protein chiPu_0027873, partial [Chiloscyllium punctatum]|nr:hypothetical protein [Chiloscyllium punctatum]